MSNPAIWTDIFLDEKRRQADPLADEAMARIIADRGPGEARRLFDLLIRRIEMPLSELPPVIGDFLAATNRLPDWADKSKIELAQRLFLDHGPKFLLFQYCKSLPLLYTDWRGAKVLVRTGRLSHAGEDRKIFARRIAETGQFLIEVMSREALIPGGTGIQTIQKIRLIHAAIRHFVQENEWDHAAWGRPINQEDMALTLLTFSQTNLEALEDLGIRESAEKQEAFIHTWNAIGTLLGVDPQLLAPGYEPARQLLRIILGRVSGPSEEGKVLARALDSFLAEHLPLGEGIQPSILIQHFIGPERTQMLGLAPPPGCWTVWLPKVMQAYFAVGEKLEDSIQGPLRPFLAILSHKITLSMVDYFDQYKGRHFTIPRYMLEKWTQAGD